MKRRRFIRDLALTGTLLGHAKYASIANPFNKLNILVLGGTNFVGPAIVNAAIENGHHVALFNRGETNPNLFPSLKHIQGDRREGLNAYDDLKSHNKWDVIIDVWPEKANLVDEATQALQYLGHHYIFISSIAVYKNFGKVGLHELSDVVTIPEERDQWYYPEEKLQAENLIKKRFPDNHTILRAGPIKGWRDPALDLAFWCIKLQRDEEIVAPGSGIDPVQFIDVKDIGRFGIMAAEQKIMGTYNCTGPMTIKLTWKDFLERLKAHLDSNTKLSWADEKLLRKHEVSSFSYLPLWAPLSEDRGFMQISNRKLLGTDFLFSPLESTVDDVVEWVAQQNLDLTEFGTSEVGMGLSRSKEIELLKAMHKG